MGIKGLPAWLRKNIPDVIHTVPLDLFSGQRIAVDASIYLYKFVCVSNAGKGNYFDMFLNMIIWLRKKNIRPIFVFDGKPPPQKDRTKEKRRENKEKLKSKVVELESLIETLEETPFDEPLEPDLESRVMSVYDGDPLDPRRKILTFLNERYKKVSSQCINFTKEDIDKIKDLLDSMGFPWIQSEYEAEKTCCWLVNRGYVKAVVTGDSDVLAYGVNIWLSEIRSGSDECRLIRYEDVLDASGLTEQQFTDFCIMCGTDYNDNIPGIGPAKAYNLIIQHGNLDVIANTNLDTNVLYYEDARGLLTIPEDIPEFIMPSMHPPSLGDLETLLFRCNSRYKAAKVLGSVYKPKFRVKEE
jgi:5'-3' exonuclease